MNSEPKYLINDPESLKAGIISTLSNIISLFGLIAVYYYQINTYGVVFYPLPQMYMAASAISIVHHVTPKIVKTNFVFKFIGSTIAYAFLSIFVVNLTAIILEQDFYGSGFLNVYLMLGTLPCALVNFTYLWMSKIQEPKPQMVIMGHDQQMYMMV